MNEFMTGTASQIEWAERIKPRVQAEFDRVANAFQEAAHKQAEPERSSTLAIIAILEEKRLAAMEHPQAGYFLREWQDIKDQVRKSIAADSRYQAIRANRRIERSENPTVKSATVKSATVKSE